MQKSCSIAAVVPAMCLLAASLAFSATATAQTTRPGAEQMEARFTEAMDAYDVQHFEAAFSRLAALADGGHAEAARVAWWMQRHGRALYGADLYATPTQRQAWAGLAMAQAQRTAGQPDS